MSSTIDIMIKDILEPSEFEVAYGKYLEDNREYVISINPLVLSVFIALQEFRKLIDCAQNGYCDLLIHHFINAVAHAKQVDKYRAEVLVPYCVFIMNHRTYPDNCELESIIYKINLVHEKGQEATDREILVGLSDKIQEAIKDQWLLVIINNFKYNLHHILDDLTQHNPHVNIFKVPGCWEIANSRYMVPNY
jgi:hypothetical protein